MTRVPGSREVNRALIQVARALKAALKQVNQQAAKKLAKGDYATSEALVASGKAIGEFQREFLALQEHWRELAHRSVSEGRASATTPLWQYYRPILRALTALGGSCTRRELERHLELSASNWLQPGDFEHMSRGTPRWKVMIRRARRPMTKEGFLEPESGKVWRITQRGRRAGDAAVGASTQVGAVG